MIHVRGPSTSTRFRLQRERLQRLPDLDLSEFVVSNSSCRADFALCRRYSYLRERRFDMKLAVALLWRLPQEPSTTSPVRKFMSSRSII